MKSSPRSLLLLFLVAGLLTLSVVAAGSVSAANGGVAGVVFFDRDGNGVRNVDETGILGVTVELQNGVCTPDATCPTTITDNNGAYQFSNLAAGTYTVRQINLPTYQSTTNDTQGVAVGNQMITGIDFGDMVLRTLTGTVFTDTNADGARGLGEPLIANAVVEVYNDADANGVVNAPPDAILGHRYDRRPGQLGHRRHRPWQTRPPH